MSRMNTSIDIESFSNSDKVGAVKLKNARADLIIDVTDILHETSSESLHSLEQVTRGGHESLKSEKQNSVRDIREKSDKISYEKGRKDGWREATTKFEDEITNLKNRVEKAIELPQSREERLGITKAPELWKDWKSRSENAKKNPFDCMREIYGQWLDSKSIYQDDIGGKDGLDPDLLKAMRNYISRRGIETHVDMPPTKYDRLDNYIENLGEEKIRAATTLARNAGNRSNEQ